MGHARVRENPPAFSVRYVARIFITHLFITMRRDFSDAADEASENCCLGGKKTDYRYMYKGVYDVSAPSCV